MSEGLSSQPPQQMPAYEDLDDFAQTRGADDLFESEIQPITRPPPAPPSAPLSAPRQPRQPRHPHMAETASTERALSGGIKKPKLTDEELAARMEQIRVNNARLTARAQKAADDQTSYQVLEEQRRAQDEVRRAREGRLRMEEMRNRKEIDDERERNRARKMKAVQAREWDSEKKEEDYNPRGPSSQYRRGANGGIASASESGCLSWDSPRGEDYRPRGSFSPRGGRGGRASRGGRTGRGGGFVSSAYASRDADTRQSAAPAAAAAKPTPLVQDESQWPDLTKNTNKEKSAVALPMTSPALGSWADQVEAGSSATPTAAP